jgi:hypothetical protein
MNKKMISNADVLSALVFIPVSSVPFIESIRQILKIFFRFLGRIAAYFLL